VSRYRFIEAQKANHPIWLLCRVVGVSRSGYYAWVGRPPSLRSRSDELLSHRIGQIHQRSRGTYGAPRIHAELEAEHGIRCGRKRIARLMREAGLEGCHRRKAMRTTRRDPAAAAKFAADLVRRDFAAPAPDRLWVADITYIPTWEGFLYLAFILDVFSRRVVGWSMANHLRARVMVQAREIRYTHHHGYDSDYMPSLRQRKRRSQRDDL
jgi:putative transposase